MKLTREEIDAALGSLIIRKNRYYYIHEDNVETAISRVTKSFDGCYAYVKPVEKLGKEIVIGKVNSKKLGKPLIEIIIRNDIS